LKNCFAGLVKRSKELSVSEAWMLACMTYAHGADHTVTASFAELAQMYGRGVRVTKYVIAALKEKGLISVAGQAEGRNTYLLPCGAPKHLEGDSIGCVAPFSAVTANEEIICVGGIPQADALHPNGRCTCGGEGRCAWCKATEENIAAMTPEEKAFMDGGVTQQGLDDAKALHEYLTQTGLEEWAKLSNAKARIVNIGDIDL